MTEDDKELMEGIDGQFVGLVPKAPLSNHLSRKMVETSKIIRARCGDETCAHVWDLASLPMSVNQFVKVDTDCPSCSCETTYILDV